MKGFTLFILLSVLSMGVARAQIARGLFTCEYTGKNGEFVLKEDFYSVKTADAALNKENAERIARVNEMSRIPLTGSPSRYVLFSDLDLSQGDDQSQTPIAKPSSTFAQGINVNCTPADHASPARPVYGNFKFLPKTTYSCNFMGRISRHAIDGAAPVLAEGVTPKHAIDVAKISEARMIEGGLGNRRFVFYYDAFGSNPIKNPSYGEGIDAICQPYTQAAP